MKIFIERFNNICDDFDFKPTSSKTAKFVGIPTSTLGKYMTGSMPSAEAILKIANAFDIDTDYLLGKTNIKNRSKTIINLDDLSSTEVTEVQKYIEFLKSKH
ncbi:helix-turn-helix domain-containing protein [Culicoidibacter larvae]|uniref:Helix-turn-helix transcriptional regulator n=1 Tax=Culicoidibacter larvae TaxID=2579976 RepID=A0A5R8Q883_9FIRM|nr:helix-turn-helix transcriptional regulator [Culicoidibacter larvae]TLG70264.1 helix-turn-helix transcriptional regulator [Culicoidibacter larvae]